jgi:uncharacterized protein (TIGR02145 family)
MKKTIILIMLAFIGLSNLHAQVGVGTTSPDPSAKLDVTSPNNDKGFLPPRLNIAQRDAIASPAQGLTIYNTDNKCLETWNGTDWISICDGSVVTSPPTIPGNVTCTGATISATPCTATELANGINGGSLGNKWANGAGGTYSVVEINGQCWMQENIDVNPSGSPTFGFNDNGWYDYYNNTYQAADEGTLMQWSAAMNGSTAERAQGVCPTGWHVPSDCEWMYLENSLGMSTADQENTFVRGTQGQDLSTFASGGTNSSGFTALPAGYNVSAFGGNDFSDRGTNGRWWTSSQINPSSAWNRQIDDGAAGVARNQNAKADGFSVRCIKD